MWLNFLGAAGVETGLCASSPCDRFIFLLGCCWASMSAAGDGEVVEEGAAAAAVDDDDDEDDDAPW